MASGLLFYSGIAQMDCAGARRGVAINEERILQDRGFLWFGFGGSHGGLWSAVFLTG
jgi:hypothetical protein